MPPKRKGRKKRGSSAEDGKGYPKQNNVNFPLEVTNWLGEYEADRDARFKSGAGGKMELFSYQKLLEVYMGERSPYRGLLIMHGLGSGKSISAINIAEISGRDTVVLLPKSLRSNFIEEIIRYVPGYERPKGYDGMGAKERRKIDQELVRRIGKKYTFISSNAGTSSEKLMKVPVSDFTTVREESLKGFKKKSGGSLDGKLLIVDEVHNLLVNMVDPSAKNGSRILNQIMNAHDLKLVFLSGSPVVSDPFELGVLFNMLRGYITIKGSKEKYTAFPRNYDEFNKYFVDRENNRIKNKEIFQERIVGLVSYYIGAESDDSREYYPYRHKPMVVKVRMSEYQWKMYVKFRRVEKDEERRIRFAKTQFVKIPNKKPARSSVTTFRVKTRQVGDFVLPMGLEKPRRKGATEGEIGMMTRKLLESIPKKDLSEEGLKKYGPKMLAIMKKLDEIKGNAFVYSQFVSLEGIGVFGRALEVAGWKNFNKTRKGGQKTFAVFSGDVGDTMREEIVRQFNSYENRNGGVVRVLLATATAAEGISLKNVRSVHIMEPYWHANRMDQIIGRAIRNGSHKDLPKHEREVESFIYLSVPPRNVNIKKALDEKLTTDEQIFSRALKNQKLLKSFTDAMKEMAIDCMLNREHNGGECRVCVANGERMYPPRVENHLLPGGSKCISEKVVGSGLKDIVIDGKKYKEDEEGRRYEYVKSMGAWVEVEGI